MLDDDEVFAALHPSLRRFAAVVGPPDVDPDDLVQEAVARTLARTSLIELDDASAYLRRVVLRLASNHRKQFARRTAIIGRHRSGEPFTDDVHSWQLDELLGVPPDERAVLYLHIVEGLPHDHIGTVLGISAEASRTRLSRGLKRLRIEHATQEHSP
jgi:RNA polymerase sigma factor (sigma-70 family)